MMDCRMPAAKKSAINIVFCVCLLAGLFASDMSLAQTGKSPTDAKPSLSGHYLNEVLRTSQVHRETLSVLLTGRQGLPIWIRNLIRRANYVSGPSRQLDLDAKTYEFFSVCEPRTCEVSTFRVLFSPDGKKAWARIGDEKSGETFLGEPEPQMLAPLRRSGL